MNKMILLSIIPLIAGCASIVTGSQQSMSVKSDPSGAKCELTNDKGTWFVSETPGSVTVHRAYGPLSVKCRKGDYSGLVTAESSTKGMMWGNVLAGGIIGASVDAGTGAGYDYPPLIDVPMAVGGKETKIEAVSKTVPVASNE